MANISKEIQSGSFFLFIGKYSNIIVQIIITGVLARLISPEEFGIVAISMVFILFFNNLSDFGLGPAIVQQKNIRKLDVDSFFWLTVAQGIILTLLFLFVKPLIVEFYNNQKLGDVLFYLSFAIFFTSINTVPNGLNRRHKKFKFIGWSTVFVNIISGTTAIILALFYGFGIYALVLKVIFDAFILFFFNLKVANYLPSFKFSFKPIKLAFKYSSYQFMYNFFHYFSRNIDNLFIGKYLGAAALGYYDNSYKLMIMPVQNLTNVISPVIHPVLAKYQDNKEVIAMNYLHLVKLLAIIGFPLSVFLFFTAQEIIILIYGSNWEPSIVPFQFLSLSVGFQMVSSSARGVFQALGNTKLLFSTTFLTLILISISLYIGLSVYSSLNTISLLIAISYIITFFYVVQMIFINLLKVKYVTLFKCFKSSILISIVLLFFYNLNIISIDNLLLSFLLKLIMFVFIYIAASFIIKEYFILNVIKKILNNLKN